ncbi:hypothetical protein PRIPAC_73066, partial [Pristionchus pacificus]|uniref:NopRA1 domain-containing protein n=1 Tax=Pristionchus pacificus TaxID=54126 RepID=A0A2A6C1T2_PRIPA
QMGEKRRRSEKEEESGEKKKVRKEEEEEEEEVEVKSKRDKRKKKEDVEVEDTVEVEEISEKKDKRKKKSRRSEGEGEEESSSSPDIFDEIAAVSSTDLDDEIVERLRKMLQDNKDDESSVKSIRARASSVPFLASLLCSYHATRTVADQSILDCLHTLERQYGVNLSVLSPLVFDGRARENYDKLRELGRFLHIKPTADQVVEWLDAQQLWTTAIMGDHPRMVDRPSQMYDTKFVLRLLLTVVQPGSELTCRLFVDRNCLSLAFGACSSTDEETRRLAMILLQRFLSLMMELKNDEFEEKSMVVYLVRLFKISLEQEAARVSHVISHFFARTSKLLLNPAHPVYSPVCAFITLKPAMEMNQVPELFKLLLSSSTENFEAEQTWLLNLLTAAVVDAADYRVLQNRSTVRLICSLFASCLSRMDTRKGALGVLKAVVSIPAAAFDALMKQNLAGWIAATIQRPNLSRWEVIYLGEIYSLLLENARVYGRGRAGAVVALALAKITVHSVTRRLGAGGVTAADTVAYGHIERAEKCLLREWTASPEAKPEDTIDQ